MTVKEMLDDAVRLLEGKIAATDIGEVVVIDKKNWEKARTLLETVRSGTPEFDKDAEKKSGKTSRVKRKINAN
jgi:hypothetical protein